ncbi:RNA polymerase II-associated protein 3 [Psilocybe cubensis]|uniref:Uncharacterized protein n=2 Tax=Psilocybe cubensis TaxID=181762 RepID=A0A8H7XMJ5_PSICU|nr:RNA polymerase II-associated protein 3 [Psilocybe cubensis]KAH9481839.1 RNA polymerase II-associated protein 3 [Psilocybe cubensis]
MPAKYSHVKKRSASGLLKKEKNSPNGHHIIKDTHHSRTPNPHTDRAITQAMSAVSQLERAIARILLIRYEQDIARLFSTRLYSIALVHLPTLVMRCVTLGGPGWLAFNHDSEDIKDFFRAAISMDMRQAGERVATKSVLWSYTALRHFALSNNVSVCSKLGLHSLRLLPYYPALKAHLDALEAMPPSTFTKPPHLGSLQEGQSALEDACELKFGWVNKLAPGNTEWEGDWKPKIQYGYEKLSQTLWRVAREFDVRGYGNILREKLTTKWCDCGCSTDHLGEVCERTVREDEEESGVRLGKQREWDGRGSGIYGWETEEEEDIWEIDLDFGGLDPEECAGGVDAEMTIGEMMEWRYLRAEKEKEKGNAAYRKGDYEEAVKCYETAHGIESELPHYQLNLAAAYLKLNNWMEAENACTKALQQHRSVKGLYRRAKARIMLGRSEEAIPDLRSALRLQPTNEDAARELKALLFPLGEGDQGTSNSHPPSMDDSNPSSSKQPSSFPKAKITEDLRRLGVPEPKSTKQPPFPRTKADDRKLKITLLSGQTENGTGTGKLRKMGTSIAADLNRPQTSRPGKEKAGTTRSWKTKEMDRMRAECVTYPSWDRYLVKRVD